MADSAQSRPVHVLGIRVEDRAKYAPEVQEVLTRYGDVIVSRAGYHNPQSTDGIITIVVEADPTIVQNLAKDLRQIEGVSAETCRLS